MYNSYSFPSFAILETDVMLDMRLSNFDKILYSFIVVLCNNKNKCCYASNSYLANLMHCDIRTIQNSLGTLKESEYIKIKIQNFNKRTIIPLVIDFLKERETKELFDYNWLDEKE